MAILNWLHLSDWHQRGPDFDRKVVRDALLKDIKAHAAISPDLAQIDLVFFTGDLAFSGQAKEYATARKELLEPVLEAVGLPKDRLFIIPGNHDIDRNAFDLLPDALLKPFEQEAQVKEWLEDTRKRKRLLEPFEAYQAFVAEWGVPGFGEYADCQTLFVNGKQIGIVGCNSALMCGRRKNDKGWIDDYGVLAVGEPQVYEPLDKLAAADVRIGLIHHPFDWLTEFDRNIVQRRLRRQCDFLLRGHQHIPSVEVTRGTSGDAMIIPAGASYDGRIPERPLYVNAYNFVHYDTDAKNGTVYLRRWSDNRSGWIADTDTADEGKFPFGERPVVQAPSPALAPTPVPRGKSTGSVPTIFISCAKADKKWREDLLVRLKPLLRNATFDVWDESRISPGTIRRDAIETALTTADAAILLVTPEFLASDTIFQNELPELLKKKILWVAVRASGYQSTPLADYQPVNDPAYPLAALSRSERDSTWVEICEKVKGAFENP